MNRFMMLVGLAVLAALPGLVLRLTGLKGGPIAEAAAFGTAILAAGFLSYWGEAAERHIAQGLIIAAAALLPFYRNTRSTSTTPTGQAGLDSEYVHYAAANMTGANRILTGSKAATLSSTRPDRRRGAHT